MKKNLSWPTSLGVMANLLLAVTSVSAQENAVPGAVFRGVRASEIALAPNEKFLAVAGWEDGTDDAIGLLIVWDLKTKKEVFRHRDPAGGFQTVAFSPDGKRLAAAGFGSLKKIKVWESPSGKEIADLQNDENVDCVRFSPDGKLLGGATLIEKGEAEGVVLWDTTTFEPRATLTGPGSIFAFAFSPDGKHLGCAEASGAAHFWNLPDGKVLKPTPIGRKYALTVSFAKSRNLFAAAGADGQVNLTADFTKLYRLDPPLVGNREAVILTLLADPHRESRAVTD